MAFVNFRFKIYIRNLKIKYFYKTNKEKTMAKLYYKYGPMGCSKSAQALMCRFNYIQKGYKVLLIKPSLETRDNENNVTYIKSRIGLKAECLTFAPDERIMA